MVPRLAALVLCAALFAATANAQGPTLKVLFIGNSYTFFNNLGDLVAGIAGGVRGRKIYASLTGRSPKGAPATIEGSPYSRTEGTVDTSTRVRLVALDRGIAEQIQDVAWQVVTANSRPVPSSGR